MYIRGLAIHSEFRLRHNRHVMVHEYFGFERSNLQAILDSISSMTRDHMNRSALHYSPWAQFTAKDQSTISVTNSVKVSDRCHILFSGSSSCAGRSHATD